MRCEEHFESARAHLPGGVTATARANRALGRPMYLRRGEGATIADLDGRSYVDMCMSHGASLLGHDHPAIKEAVRSALDLGILCAYETEHHARLAERLSVMVPCAEMSRFAGSGSETVMHGLRLARAATGRTRIIKFEGHFHGYSDPLYYSVSPPVDKAGPPGRPMPYPESSGMPAHGAEQLVILPFNDFAALEAAFAEEGDRAAALFMEPINYDSGCILPEPGFVARCRELCDEHGVLLFFDEVLTAFRLGPGCAQGCLGVTPDLCVLGKALGAGMPISALAGKREVMRHLRPLGDSEMSGTYLAHLTAVMSALAALEEYSKPGFYDRLAATGDPFFRSFQGLIAESGVPARLQRIGPRFGIYFGIESPVTNYREAAGQDRGMLLTFIAGCIARGAYLAVSPHHGFSAAHTEADLGKVLEAIRGSLADVKEAHPSKGASHAQSL
jgi:glutamate-1-semialdehyde 2,1-aminomutase